MGQPNENENTDRMPPRAGRLVGIWDWISESTGDPGAAPLSGDGREARPDARSTPAPLSAEDYEVPSTDADDDADESDEPAL